MIERTFKEDMKENFKEVGALFTILALVMGVFLFATGCNQQIIDLKYRFDKAVIAIPGSGTNKVVKVKKWMDYQDSDMVQVIAEDGTIYYGHSNNILLIKEP